MFMKIFNPSWRLMDQCQKELFTRDHYYTEPLLLFDVKNDNQYKELYVLQRELDKQYGFD